MMYISYGSFAIQHADVLKYPLFIQNANTFDIFIFQSALAAGLFQKMHAFDTNFFDALCGWGKVALLSTLLKASDVFFLFSADGNILW